MTQRYGATPDEWDHFSLILGLTEDMLPVVSNPEAKISPESKMKGIGKTPSRYNGIGHVVGFAKWTQYKAQPSDVSSWRARPDYGICLQTRNVRALDCDITNTILAKDIHDEITKFLLQALPCRSRDGSPKFLLAFSLPDDYAKRTIKTDHGIIEFLATGQQFIAAGTHPSGERYTWRGGLPESIPALTPEQFERLWARLVECFASEPPVEHKASTKNSKLTGAIHNDPVAKSLYDSGAVISAERDGRLHIQCPFAAEHTSDTGESSTTYFPAFTGGFERGHFHCLHAHCSGRSDGEFRAALGIPDPDLDDFDIIPAEGMIEPAQKASKYVLEPFDQFRLATPPGYFVDGVLPRAALAVIYGESTSGKTFVAIDLAHHIARGAVWRDRAVEQGRVVYIAAEDANGVRMRFLAAQRHFDLPAGIAISLLADAPNFTKGEDVAEVLKAIKAGGGADVIFVDTFAQVTAGANENSGEDMGTALGYCRALHKHTGALIVLIHHSGKDTSKGARGHSSMRAAADAEFEVTRSNDDREIEIRKLKNDADGARFGFKLLPVVTGRQDRHGEDVVSCVVEHSEKTRTAATKRRPLTESGRRVMDVLNEWTVGGQGPTYDELKAAVKATMPEDPAATRDLRGQAAARGIKDALAKNYIHEVSGRYEIKEAE